MKVWHLFSVAWDRDRQAILDELGIRTLLSPLPGGGGLSTFRIAEDDPHWAAVSGFAARWGVSGLVETEFSREEILAAPFCALRPAFVQGYPQPRQDFAFRLQTYDTTHFCEQCGIGLVQVAPFRMKATPNWRSNVFLQLNWVFDEFFVRSDAWQRLRSTLDIDAAKVLTERGNLLESVLQLRAELPVELATAGLAHESCDHCGQIRFEIVKRGYLPTVVAPDPAVPIGRSRQWFGSGAKAFNLIIVARPVAATLLAQGMRGLMLHPCAASVQ